MDEQEQDAQQTVEGIMSSETALAERAETQLETTILHATNAEDMARAQDKQVAWVTRKIETLTAEHNELTAACESAEAGEFEVMPFRRAIRKAAKHIDYYSKIKEALTEGYTLIPRMFAETFAVRTKRIHVPGTRRDYRSSVDMLHSEGPALGKGRYVGAALVVTSTTHTNYEGKQRTRHFATDFTDVDFPLTAVPAKVIDATTRAMALEAFDELGIVNGKTDPIVVGIIKRPGRPMQSGLFFLVAWFVDLKSL